MEGDRSGATEDLRIRSAVPPPSPASSPSEKEYDERIVRLASSSDEEWVETASEASSATNRSKHIRSEESSLPRSSAAESSDDSEGILAAPPRRTQFESWSDLEDYLKLYESETYQINACVQVVDPTGPKLTSVRLEHNHPLSRHTYNQYPGNRTALKPDVLSTRNLDLPSKLKEIKVLTSQVDVLDIAGKGLITDEIMHKILAKIFGSKDGITVFDSSTLGTVVDGK
ncbi:hypothetical protein F442_20342, partial [Phytophthora nicotianae P10297]